ANDEEVAFHWYLHWVRCNPSSEKAAPIAAILSVARSRCRLTKGRVTTPVDRRASVSRNRLVVERRECAVGIVLRLERAVRVAAIDAIERLAVEEAVRVERLDAAQCENPVFDQPIELMRREAASPSQDVPEAEVDIELAGVKAVQRKTIRGARADQRAG